MNKDINHELQIKPIELAETLPSSFYTEDEFLKADKEIIFSNTWQYIGSASQLNHAGDYIVDKIADNPIIIVKGDDRVIRGFYNVCIHRAGPIAYENGNSNVLKCKYHGWTYNHQGKLIGLPEFEGVQDFDKNNCSLNKINVEIWEGLIFANLSENPKPLNDFFSGIKERISPIQLSTKKFHTRIIYDIKCNWKVYVDNYLEGYHLYHVHPELSELLDYKSYTTEVDEYYSLQYSAFKGNDNLYNANDGEAFYYFVYPNFMLNILPGRLQTNMVIPQSVNHTKVVFDYYYDDTESQTAKETIKNDLEYSDIVQDQDIKICQHVQSGLESKSYNKGRLSVKRELGLYHFQNLIRKSYLNNL